MSSRMEQIEATLHEDITHLMQAKDLLNKCGNMHDSKIVEILMMVAGEIALREFELKQAARYKLSKPNDQPDFDVKFPPVGEVRNE